MDSESEISPKIEHIKSLTKPEDIMKEAIVISRETQGRAVLLMTSTSNPDLKIWFWPKAMQEEQDNSDSQGNTHVKFHYELEQEKLKVEDVQILPETKDEFGLNTEIEDFLNENGMSLYDDDYSSTGHKYAGRFEKEN